MIIFLVYCVSRGYPDYLHRVFHDYNDVLRHMEESKERYAPEKSPLYFKELWVHPEDIHHDCQSRYR